MKYRECLNLIKEQKLNLKQLLVASEVNNVLGKVVSKYEEVCQYIYSCALETDMISVNSLCECFYNELMNNGETEDELLDTPYYKFIDKASCF